MNKSDFPVSSTVMTWPKHLFLMRNVDFIHIIPKELLDNTRSLEIRNTQINIGTGREITIAHLAEIIKIIIKYKGNLVFNTQSLKEPLVNLLMFQSSN